MSGENPETNPLREDALSVAPSLNLVLEAADAPKTPVLVDQRVLRISLFALVVGVLAAVAARVLILMISLFTNMAFFGRISLADVSPADNHLGWFVVLVPIGGALIVGLMARFGSSAIRGHGIPEAMEQVLTNHSRIPARLTFLKPLSAAVSIGTGGPFGAEGPIIATGGAFGSLLGQMFSMTAAERKTLLAAGAAAGMAATFGSPVSAVLLAIELLLFEFRARSIIPVAIASVAATGMHIKMFGAEPIFAMPNVVSPSMMALSFYVLLGGLVGAAAVVVTRFVYLVEDTFESLPIHWMWWPALGAIAVGICGYFSPRTLGVGYYNIGDILSGSLAIQAVLALCALKCISWSISLGSGTSGGTLAPLLTIGGGLGAALGVAGASLWGGAGIDPRVAALVGMAAMFAGASRALLTSVVFAFETTLQPMGLLPLLGGCASAYLVSGLGMRHTIMTERIARRGVRTPAEYMADALDQWVVSDVASAAVVAIRADDTIDDVVQWIESGAEGSRHQGFPVLDADEVLVGVLTRRDLMNRAQSKARKIADLIHRNPKFVYEDCSVRQAADHMANHSIGRLPVLSRDKPPRLKGIITRSDILSCYRRQLEENNPQAPTVRIARKPKKGQRSGAA